MRKRISGGLPLTIVLALSMTAMLLVLLALRGAPSIALAGPYAQHSAHLDPEALSAYTAQMAAQALPPPNLSDSDAADAPYGASPVVDGRISPGEYAGAGKVTFPGYGGDVEVFFRQDGITLYIAFEMPDQVNPGPYADIYLDTNHDGGSSPQIDDFDFRIARDKQFWEYQGTGSVWQQNIPITWTYGLTETMSGWSVEYGIPFTKLGINAGTFKAMGLALGNLDAAPGYWWPATSDHRPDAWGHLVSSSDWGTFYWKPGPWQDYAPSGLPDIDQKQPGWMSGTQWTHCGPVAAANSLWWFDSKMETPGHTPPPAISDTYRLITSYNSQWDDHDISNVVPLVSDLATNYFGTNQGITGTSVISMFYGTQNYMRAHGLWDDYIVTLVMSPSFKWVADEVMRSEDVILLLGFWEWVDPDGLPGSGDEYWARVGGHFVTVAGVGPNHLPMPLIAFSDPFVDATENGVGVIPPGRVLSGTLLSHYPPHPGPDPITHNDAGNVSHDVYQVGLTNSPGGTWGPYDYPWNPDLFGANPHPDFHTKPWQSGMGQVEVEFALTVSPYKWKSSGYWDEEQSHWQPWIDYAPNGLPDFDQKQDGWSNPPLMPVPPAQWSFCGPVAAANSLWWFDSKFEPNPVGPPIPPPYSAIPYNDNYPLVSPYISMPPPWDDHDPLNVDNLGTPWPPPPGQGEFIEDLARYFQTDQITKGTIITDLYQGIISYTIDHNLRQGYVITQVKSPEFWWVAEEVEHSEDVILLLGFYATYGPGVYERAGGHYVTVPGVDKQGGLIAFSDPYWNRAETWWPYAYPGGQPQWMGRVTNGWLYPHIPIPGHPVTYHNDAGNLSHDVYYVVSTDSPGGNWGPQSYVSSTTEITNFFGMNDGGFPPPLGWPVQTEVEWAVSVSPVADVWVTKTVTPAIAIPGDWVTFTIAFSNAGSLPARDVVITDNLPSGLASALWSYWTSNGLTVTARTGVTFAWDLADLAWMEGGIITVTAQADPSDAWPASINLTNVVTISTSSVEQYQVKSLPNAATATLTVQTADVIITKTASQASMFKPGDWITFTLVYSIAGSATATGVVITDLLPTPPLTTTGAGYTWTNNYGGALTPVPGRTFVWDAGNLAAGNTGIITITAQVDPNLTTGGRYTNTAEISTRTFDRDRSNNKAEQGFQACLPPAGAHFTYTPLTPIVSQTVTFTGSVTQGTLPLAYLWDFSAGNPITHVFSAAGPHTVWMTATNTCGQSTYTETLTVCEPVGNVSIQYTPPDPRINQTILLTATASGSTPITYTWTADDGWSASGAAANHAFASRGNHTVWLTATNNCGQLSTSVVILVREYGVGLRPTSGSSFGNPGNTITYALTLSNTGNVSDTFTIAGSVAEKSWTTNWPATVGPVTASGTAQFNITVQIPSSGVNEGDWSQVTITATSQGDASKNVTGIFTTTATTQVITRSVVIAPHVVTQTGDAGTTVTYTLRVTNTGNLTDTINLSTNSPAWNTSLSSDEFNLTPGAGQPLEVYVQIPSSASEGARDTATITARSAGAPAIADSATLTTTAHVPVYSVELTPPTARQDGHPGDVLTYTLTVRNTGERSDTYDLSKTGNVWSTTLPVSIGPIAPAGIAQFNVAVKIADGASGGSRDVVTITAVSQHNMTRQDSSTLTTMAISSTQPITRGVALTATVTAQEGAAGDWVTYTLRLTNTGNAADLFNLSWQASAWPTDLSAFGVSVEAGQGVEIAAFVQVPITASDGDMSTGIVKATSANDALATDSVTLTTTAHLPSRPVYLPVVMRNFP